MKLDICLPLGLLFTLIGSLLVCFGLAHVPASTTAGINVNAYWGAVLVLFGAGMLLLARRHTLRARRGTG
jgi:hypothetical protein